MSGRTNHDPERQKSFDRNFLLFSIYTIICWLTSLPTPIMALTPLITNRYFPYWNNWGYVTSNERRNLFITIDTFVLLAKVSLSTLIYFVTISYIICLVSGFLTSFSIKATRLLIGFGPQIENILFSQHVQNIPFQS